MDPQRKRRVRLVVALTAALALAGALVYTSFSAASDAVDPTQLLASADSGRTYQLSGKVAAGSVNRNGDHLGFEMRDRDGRVVGQRDSLITKCPSKFKSAPPTAETR